MRFGDPAFIANYNFDTMNRDTIRLTSSKQFIRDSRVMRKQRISCIYLDIIREDNQAINEPDNSVWIKIMSNGG
jgi:hypothetical protein